MIPIIFMNSTSWKRLCIWTSGISSILRRSTFSKLFSLDHSKQWCQHAEINFPSCSWKLIHIRLSLTYPIMMSIYWDRWWDYNYTIEKNLKTLASWNYIIPWGSGCYWRMSTGCDFTTKPCSKVIGTEWRHAEIDLFVYVLIMMKLIIAFLS